MFLSYYGLDRDLFKKEISEKEAYKSSNYKEMMSRLEYIKEIKGIGLFVGEHGIGKTYTLRCFKEKTNKELYKIIYISVGNLTVFEFLNVISKELGLDTGNCYRNEMESNIQSEIKRMISNHKDIILILDNAQNLSREMIQSLKFLYDFDMDSVDYVSIVICGSSEIEDELKKKRYEHIKQRIILKYHLKPLTREETKEYIKTRLKLSGQDKMIYTEAALNALYNISKGNIRILNNIIKTTLIVGYQQKKEMIDEEIVRMAKEEVEI